ncbi:DNA-directed RNA polymerase subunit A' [Candidatus Woesearchaeota archaeon]|nr:DNA-directed RNA polymerase subunit A' [Candidatus Woesearchaeota archaeon]
MEDMDKYVYKKIDSIDFGILSPKLIKNMTSAKIVTAELYDKEGYPVDGGLMDLRLGVIDPGLRCKTCGQNLKECPGHFGYIELARPLVHISFIPRILNVLRSTCSECGYALMKDSRLKKELAEVERLKTEGTSNTQENYVKKLILNMRAQSSCPHCGAKKAKVALEKPTTFIEEEKRITPIEIRSRLEKIPSEHLPLFGFNPDVFRPEWMILTLLTIPSVTMRPSITLESGERSEDDLTHKLGDIVRINQRLFENINAGAPEIIIEDLWDLLQYHVTTFFDNAVAQLPPARHRSGQPLKTISERIKSKEGRIRHNLAGKRTNFSARTAISPDARLGINEVGVPKIIAMKLSVPERVTAWNIEYLKKFVENGHDKYPGANYIERPDGKKKKITSETKEAALEELQPGYIVERHLLDGDIAIFNRQPSLHRMSMMCHKVKVLPYKTFRMNPSVNNPYNADYDGDEMNLHIPQTEEARAEAEILMQVQTQLISPGHGGSVIGCIQDAVSGNYVLTKFMNFTRQEAVDLLYAIGVDDIKVKKDVVTGAELVSNLFPSDFTFIGKDKAGEDIEIRNGQLIKGILDGVNLGGGSGLLIRRYHQKYGADQTSDLLYKLFRLGIEVLTRYGFTSKISDLDLPAQAEEQIKEVLDVAQKDVRDMIEQYEAGTFDVLPGKDAKETLEVKIIERLNNARNEAGEVVNEYSKRDSNTMTMAISGAKGKMINFIQMGACVGQQVMRGGRLHQGYEGRTLSVFKKGSLDSKAHGFIKDGFRKGLDPSEFYFQAMVGRDSLMDTALRTPKSGYLYRRLVNAMQDFKIEYDGTVRDASQKIVQFKYGEDGIDVSKSEKGKINVKRIVQEVMSK